LIFEQGLNFAIRQIRAVLEDERDRPTVSRDCTEERGIALIARSSGLGSDGAVAAAKTQMGY